MIPIRDDIPSRAFPVVNSLIIGVNALVFLWELTLSPEELKLLFNAMGLVPVRYAYPVWAELSGVDSSGSWWPFLTNTFLHGGWGHFLSNMWTLYIFGDNVEDRMGKGRYLLFYLICGLAASATQFAFNMESTLPTIGASGAISGVMAAYMFMYPRSKIQFLFPLLFFPLFFKLSAFVYIGIWFAGQLLIGTSLLFDQTTETGIAFWAHIGGFVAGMLLYSLFAIKPPHEPVRQRPPFSELE